MIFLEMDECQTLACGNGATCVDELDDYMCQCTDQWLGKNCTGIYNAHFYLSQVSKMDCDQCEISVLSQVRNKSRSISSCKNTK